jgi:hypothetical protein
LVLRNLVFEGCPRAAVSVQEAALVSMEAITYRGNSNPRKAGGALILQEVAIVELVRCSFYRNTAAHAGALLISNSATAVVSGCNFTENSAKGSYPADLLPLSVGEGLAATPRAGGAALFVEVANVDITGSTFLENKVSAAAHRASVV